MPILTGSTGGPLLQAADLADFAGAPFTDSQALRAGESIRSEVGWHVAPSVVETLTVESEGTRYLFLPTLRLTGVTEVRNVTDPDNPVIVTGWTTANTLRFRAGCLLNRTGWPSGDLEVDVVHGYDACPADLVPVAAAVARQTKKDTNLSRRDVGGVSLSFIDGLGSTAQAAIDRYTIPPRP